MFKIVKNSTLKDLKTDIEELQAGKHELRGDLLKLQRRFDDLQAELMHAENSARIARELLGERDQNA